MMVLLQFSSMTILILMEFSTAKGCTLTNTSQKANLGWPLLVSCTELLNECYDIFSTDGMIKCTMRYEGSNNSFFDSGTFDYFATDNYPMLKYQTTDVEANTTDIEITVQSLDGTACCNQNLQLEKEELANTTCDNSVRNNADITFNESRENGKDIFITCEVQDEPNINISQYEITWYYNCNQNLPEGVRKKNDGSLEIDQVNYTLHPGVYSCSIENNEETRFIQHENLCVERESDVPSRLAVACKMEGYRVDLNSTVEVICNVTVKDNDVDTNSYTMEFYPLRKNGRKDFSKDKISCVSSLGGNRTYSPNDTRVSCLFSYIANYTSQCFNYTPTEEEWENNKTTSTLLMSYRIERIETTDFGLFHALATISGNNYSDSFNFTIEENSHPICTVAIVGGVIGGVLGLLVIATILWWFRLEIRFYIRRSGCTPYAKAPGRYGAYMLFAIDTGALYDGIEKVLRDIGCPLYNPTEEPPTLQLQAENNLKIRQMCDRIIAILTPGFIAERYDDQLYMNLEDIIVIIKTPDVDLAIENMEKARRNTLETQLRQCTVIKWDGNKTLSRRFKMELELAMPKRRPVEPVIYENGYAEILANDRL